jgi:hypothetical protein
MDGLENCGLYAVACLIRHIFSTLWIISIHGEPFSFFHSISSEVIILCNQKLVPNPYEMSYMYVDS